jgi:hypothetical protein
MELAVSANDGNTMLSGDNWPLTILARPVAASARPLLAASHAQLLSLTTTSEHATPVMMCWNGPVAAVALQSAIDLQDPGVARHIAAFAACGQRLLVELARRWPSYAVPPAIGIVTDGGGVVFSADHPSPLSPDWLARHQAGLCVPTKLLPFSGASAWSLLTAPRADRWLH